MTYCPYYKECKTPCHRAFTDEVKGKSELPHWIYTKKPECFKETKDAR